MFVDTVTRKTRFEEWQLRPATVQDVLANIAPIQLDELGEAALLDRVEVKYVVSAEILPAFVSAIAEHYRVLTVGGQTVNRYKSLYFDSAEFTLYHKHHAGAGNRHKIRARQYVETGISFLELKQKTNKKRTLKKRIETDHFQEVIDRSSGDFLREACPYNIDALFGRLLSHYSRITLVNRYNAERVTIDLDLTFEWDGRVETLDDIAIIEVKRAPFSAETPAIKQLRRQHLRPSSFSKYCIGVSKLYPDVKHNNFKPVLRQLDKLSQGARDAQR